MTGKKEKTGSTLKAQEGIFKVQNGKKDRNENQVLY
jgi:hypothetical protein